MLATIEPANLWDFFLYIFDQENEEKLWSIWLAKDVEQNFEEFKKERLKRLRTKTVSGLSDEEITDNIDSASQFIKVKGG